MHFQSCIVILGFALWLPASDSSDSLLGKWYTEEGKAMFHFYKCGTEYRARLYPLAHPDIIDRHNPVDSLKSQKVSGTTTIFNLRFNGTTRQWDGGNVYNPSNGKLYNCHCRLLEGGDRLLFRGYLGVAALGQNRTWTRVLPP